MKFQELALDSRPRERLERYGTNGLSSAELLALILKSGTKKQSILEMCNSLLIKYPLQELARCSLAQLTKEYGIGKAKACQLLAVFELAKRVDTKEEQVMPITCAADVARRYTSRLGRATQEQVLAMYLDTKNKVIKEEIVTIGILDASLIHPREIFHGAIRHCASALIVIHNHPSGDPTPSSQDLEVTKRLAKTGETVGITFLDHVIIGREGYWSWKEGRKSLKWEQKTQGELFGDEISAQSSLP
ncbi:DNA repair protein RadC [Candidatus Woesearchaeota archaeon]|nr:DNA repair protein RadC [Candidatus Woesearchaeota archaeon]